MRLFLSYCKSHIYDLHSILAATITFLLMFLIKKPIKKRIADKVEQKALADEQYSQKKDSYIKLWNGVLVLITMVLAFIIFELLAVFSPMIHSSYPSALMSGAIALTEYAVWEQLCIHKKGEY